LTSLFPRDAFSALRFSNTYELSDEAKPHSELSDSKRTAKGKEFPGKMEQKHHLTNPFHKRYLSTRELAESIPLTERSIRRKIQEGIFLKGVHFKRPNGTSRVIWDWQAIERWVQNG